MTSKASWRALTVSLALLSTATLTLAWATSAQVAPGQAATGERATLEAPESAPAGATLSVKWSGPNLQYDRIVVVPAGAPEKARPSRESEYTNNKGKPVNVRTPEEPGTYEIRYQDGKTAATLGRRALTLTPVSATLSAPASVVGGATLSVKFVGPDHQYDKLGIVPAEAPEGTKPPSRQSSYTERDGEVNLVAPEQPGAYEIRYLTAHKTYTLGRSPLTITAAGATLTAPATALSGSTVEVKFKGPNNQYDRIVIVPAGTPERDGAYGRFSAYTDRKGVVRVPSPEQVGEHEVRYVSAQSKSTLASSKITLTPLSASLQAPATVTAGAFFRVQWQGPGNDYDYIGIAKPGASKDVSRGRAYVRPSPALVQAPLEVGEYELRYRTGQRDTILATTQLQVTPAKAEPGLLRVTANGSAAGAGSSAGNAVEVILDASGSMLQRIGSERRIDIAKRTLETLVSETIPVGTPFALRVFGREADSCQTDLDIPLRPLDVAAARAKVRALEAKANAKTPIGASLEQVASDLASVKGDRVVVLVTDGEETCGGEPATAIGRLTKGGASVRVNIVGFAIDDSALASTFEHWARTGNGAYFEARDAAELQRALAAALQVGFEVLDAKSQVVATGVANGEPVQLLPGKYTVRPRGSKAGSKAATVRPKETTAVQL